LNQAHEAVVKLSGLLKKPETQHRSNTLQGFIDRIVSAEQLVALTAIDDAARLGGDAGLIARAKDALAAGDARAATNPSRALVFYEKAWKLRRRRSFDQLPKTRVGIGRAVAHGCLCIQHATRVRISKFRTQIP